MCVLTALSAGEQILTGSHESKRAANADVDQTPEQPEEVRGGRFGESAARYSQVNERKGKDPVDLPEMSHAGTAAGKSGAGNNNGKKSETVTKQQKFSKRRSDRDSPLYAALDLGTNNCRLLVAKPTRRGFMIVDAFSRIIRLGEGVSHSGTLSEPAMKRTIDALKMCSEKMLKRGVNRSRQIATEACRVAENSQYFIDRVREETGLDLEIISQETEARLAVSGCASLLDKNCQWSLVFDIGGGSSELIWLDLSRRKRKWRHSLPDRIDAQNCIVAWTSLPIGVVTLAEKYGGREVDSHTFENMVNDVMDPLREFEARHNILPQLTGRNAHFLGTSGTVTTVAGIHLKLPTYNRRRVDGSWLSDDDVKTVTDQLLTMSYEQRVAQPCVGIDRADLVLAGCAILEALIRIWPCQRLRVADRGLREGILATLIAEDNFFQVSDDG